MSNPYVSPDPTAPNPWSTGSGFGKPSTQQTGSENVDFLSQASYQAYPPTADPEPAGYAAPQFSGSAYPPVAYGGAYTQSYGGYALQPEHPSATATLVLGVIGVLMMFVGFPITGPIAWWMGSKARREMRERPGFYRESGTLTAGWVMGIVATIALIGLVLILGLGFALFAAAIAHG